MKEEIGTEATGKANPTKLVVKGILNNGDRRNLPYQGEQPLRYSCWTIKTRCIEQVGKYQRRYMVQYQTDVKKKKKKKKKKKNFYIKAV